MNEIADRHYSYYDNEQRRKNAFGKNLSSIFPLTHFIFGAH